jgi:hypothetical protein
MRNLRTALLLGVTASLTGLLAWRWASERGLVTLNYSKAPLSTVIESIERQGRVEIGTNADLATPVTIRLNRAPLFEAIDTLAVRIDADARLAYIAAPNGTQIRDGLAAFSSDTNPGGWMVFSPAFGGRTLAGEVSPPDPRHIEWKVAEAGDRSLQAMLDQGAQKTGAVFAVPFDWNPVLGKLPSSGRVGKVTSDLLRNAKGNVKEIFLLTVRSSQVEEAPGRAEFGETRRNGSRAVTVGEERRGQRTRLPGSILPIEEQAEARRRFDEMHALWESIRGLPEQERHARIEEHMNSPEVQIRMEDRAVTRDARRTPEQREQRFRNYIRRKEQAKGVPTRS